MSLIDADDVLESGIDVVAQPPGKRLQNVLLLSGGERRWLPWLWCLEFSITARSILFIGRGRRST